MADPFNVTAFTEDLIPAVKAFNARLLAAGLDASLHCPDSPVPRYPRRPGQAIYQQLFLLIDSARCVRGGFTLTQEEWRCRDENTWIAHLKLPISEGVVNPEFKTVGPLVFQYAMQQQPRLYMLGMGGFQSAVTNRLAKFGWSLAAVPFYFKLLRASAFLRTSPYLRRRPILGAAATFAAASGLGALAAGAWNCLQSVSAPALKGLDVERVDGFGPWATDLWERSRGAYALIAPRDAVTLNLRYQDRRFIRLKITRAGSAIGWATLLDTRMKANKYFGDARVGTIVDGLAAPDDACLVVAAATKALSDAGVDLLVCNHAHEAWARGLRRSGFLQGPSNYVFGLSPELAGRVGPLEQTIASCFITRGDGAGPERLMAETGSVCHEL